MIVPSVCWNSVKRRTYPEPGSESTTCPRYAVWWNVAPGSAASRHLGTVRTADLQAPPLSARESQCAFQCDLQGLLPRRQTWEWLLCYRATAPRVMAQHLGYRQESWKENFPLFRLGYFFFQTELACLFLFCWDVDLSKFTWCSQFISLWLRKRGALILLIAETDAMAHQGKPHTF